MRTTNGRWVLIELVERFVCTGDTGGNEAGTRTGVVVHFNPIVIREL